MPTPEKPHTSNFHPISEPLPVDTAAEAMEKHGAKFWGLEFCSPFTLSEIAFKSIPVETLTVVIAQGQERDVPPGEIVVQVLTWLQSKAAL